ncbi:protein kinase [Tahibacter sp. UC22_41]|uniref:serine/threonine-protein kinase n=1 Tax=Tahibacter sp. UC22_41 TaxID=3350178 RepID=UPI0036DF5058
MNDLAAGLSGVDAQATVTGLILTHELRIGEVVAARFRIEELLGVGGMGMVYRARDLSLNVEVAIKLLRPELARKPEAFERLRNELLLARQVSSPHVVRIHDIARDGERWLISMDYIAGESLERRLERAGPLPVESAVALARGLLAGLSAAHQRGVVHRDLKPANILFDRDDLPYLTDFGVARSLGATGLTQTGLIVGTPEYLSPEQARGDALDGRSDLYTLGLILYEALSGSLPFAGGTPAETVMRRLVRPPPPLARVRPDLPAWLLAFVGRLLEMKPAHRFASADEALRALEQRRMPRSPRSRRFWFVAALIAVAALGLFELGRRELPLRLMPAPAAVATIPRVAVLPLQVDAADAVLAAAARAIEEHARQWLRGDAGRAVATRERVLDAVARAAPDLGADALQRRLPEVAQAAGVTQWLHGELRRDGAGLVLSLRSESATPGQAAATIEAHGADAAALFADYRRRFAEIATTAAPALGENDIAAYGEALRALDANQPVAAAERLQALPAAAREASALLLTGLLQAQVEARQEVSAEATRERIRQTQATATDLPGRIALAQAQASAEARARLLQQALAAHAHDAALVLQTAQTLAEAGQGERGLQLLQTLVGEDSQDARAWFLLGRIAIQQGQARRAVDDYLLRALVLWTRAGDTAAEAEARNALGVGYERLGQLDAASEQYTRAAAMRAGLGDARGQATSLRNLAIVQAIRGERAAAEATLERARGVLEALGDRASIADLHNDRGVVAEERGDFRAALTAFREALALRQQLDQPTLLAQSLNNVAFCYFQLGEIDNAAVYWQQALASYRQIDDREGALQVIQSMGLLELSRGHYADAGRRLDGSLREAQDLQLPEEIDVAEVYRGELALAEGRGADALAAARAAAAGFERRGDRRGLAEARLLLARTSVFLGDAAGAQQGLQGLTDAELSPEQQALLLLTRARLEALDDAGAASAARDLAEAERIAGDARNAALLLDIRVERAQRALRTAPASADRLIGELVAEAARRGQAPLQLAVITVELDRARRGGNAAAALPRYREAQALLRQLGRWQGEARLQALGAALLRRAGQADEAAAAAAAAERARAQALDAAPAELRDAFARRLQASIDAGGTVDGN